MDIATIEQLFWIALGVLVYTWFGYPLLLFVCERLMYTPVRKETIEPRISILVVAHDEEKVIAQKIENLLALDYPKSLLEIVVASDGSHDHTADIVRRYGIQGVKLRAFPLRRGKPSVLNDVVPELTGEIVVLADARQRLDKDILRRIVPNFGDPAVGGVSGELVFEKPEAVGIAVSMDTYWRYEKWIRLKESGIHSTVGGTGAIFALRRELYRPLPGETILDDVVLPFQIVKRGYRVVMEMGAHAWDVTHTSWQREFTRKARTLSGNFQIFFNLRRMGSGVLGPISFQYFSHKVLRLLGPFCLIVLLLANWHLVKNLPAHGNWRSLYTLCLGGQLAFYGLAVLGFLFRGALLRIPFVALPNAFSVMQLAVVVGLLRYGSGRDDALWEKAHALNPATFRQRLWRLFFDSFLFTAGFILAYHLRYMGKPPNEAFDSYLHLFPYFEIPIPAVHLTAFDVLLLDLGPTAIRFALPTVMLIPLAVFYFFRINETRLEEITPEYFLTLIKGVFYATLVLFLVIYVRRASVLREIAEDGVARVVSIPTSVLFVGFVVNCLTIGGWRLALSGYRQTAAGLQDEQKDLILVGESPLDEDTLATVAQAFTPPARLVATYSRPDLHPRITPADELRHSLAMVRPDGLLVETESLSRDQVLQTIAVGDERSLPVQLLPGELELLLDETRPRLTSYIPVLEPGSSGGGEPAKLAKRALDILLGFFGLLAMPFLTALMIASRFVSPPGRRVRVQGVCRVGRHGRAFASWRLRFTAEWPGWWVWLARWSLLGVELLLGYRSLVGPRALLPRTDAALSPLGRRFLTCRPGIVPLPHVVTCQTKRLDRRSAGLLYYARHHRLAMDLQILLDALNRRSQRCAAPTSEERTP